VRWDKGILARNIFITLSAMTAAISGQLQTTFPTFAQVTEQNDHNANDEARIIDAGVIPVFRSTGPGGGHHHFPPPEEGLFLVLIIDLSALIF